MMKKSIYTLLYITLFGAVFFSSCTKNFDKINTDPINIYEAKPEQLLASALVNTVGYNMIRNRNFTNELMQVTVDMGDAEGRTFRYDFRPTVADYLYNGWYSELTNFKDIYIGASDSLNTQSNNSSYKAISLICQSWIYSLLTDTYGDVPYFESNRAKKELGNIKEPKFDRQQTIYTELFKNLEQANNLLKEGKAITASSDPVYGGDISKWRKFCNSLYLRLLLRVSGKTEMQAYCINKIKEIVELSPANYPIINNNSESAILRWTGADPYISPYIGVRAQDFRGVAIASFFINNLTTWNDPRINAAFGKSNVNRWGIAPGPNGFTGVPSGYAPNAPVEKASYFYAIDQTVSGTTPPPYTLQNDPMTGMILNASEVNLALSEIALKGWISGNPETYYNTGVLYSITQWLPNYTTPIQDYLNAADMQWMQNETFDEKMEKIHLQKYYALFCNDLQQWFEYRRTGHPVLPKLPAAPTPTQPIWGDLKNNGIMPARMPYPVYIQSTNPTNYKEAIAAQGLDVMSTMVWWQKP